MNNSSLFQQVDLRTFARALLNVSGKSHRQVLMRIDVNPQNVATWLNGRKDSLSEEKIAEMLYRLGVRHGQLRDDMLHVWRVENVEDVQSIMAIVGKSAQVTQYGVLHALTSFGCGIFRFSYADSEAWALIDRPLSVEPPARIDLSQFPFVAYDCELIVSKEEWASWLSQDLDPAVCIAAIKNRLPPADMPNLPDVEWRLIFGAASKKGLSHSEIFRKTREALGI